jgi:hypothetical protein
MVLFASTRGDGVHNLYRRAADGSRPEELVYSSKANKTPNTWTAFHGGAILFTEGGFSQKNTRADRKAENLRCDESAPTDDLGGACGTDLRRPPALGDS